MKRSNFAALLALGLIGAAAAPHEGRIVTYRDTGCGCCEGWVAAARKAGYSVDLHDIDRAKRLARFGLTESVAGCHTSLIGGYIVEGHVPLEVVARLLRERPRVRGIALPGMPMGVPGMEGVRVGSVDIVTLEAQSRVFARV